MTKRAKQATRGAALYERLKREVVDAERQRDAARAESKRLRDEIKNHLASSSMGDVARFIAGELDWYARFAGTLDSQPSSGGTAFGWTQARKFAAAALAETMRRLAAEKDKLR